MKHYFTILIPFCVTGLIAVSIIALNQDGFVLFRFSGGEMIIDGRQQQ